MADQTHAPAPDYELAPHLPLDPDQLRVLLEPTRMTIVDLLTDRAATTSHLAEALGKPKGTIGYHCKALEEAGLIRVVRTRQVRAVEERYYGRTARTFLLGDHPDIELDKTLFLQRAMNDLSEGLSHRKRLAGLPSVSTLRHVRIPDHRAKEWERRLIELVEEFVTEPRGGDTAYGLLVALYPTARPVLPEESG